jgi:hypothetical protein
MVYIPYTVQTYPELVSDTYIYIYIYINNVRQLSFSAHDAYTFCVSFNHLSVNCLSRLRVLSAIKKKKTQKTLNYSVTDTCSCIYSLQFYMCMCVYVCISCNVQEAHKRFCCPVECTKVVFVPFCV